MTMSLSLVLERVAQIEAALSPQAAPATAAAATQPAATAATAGAGAFSSYLQSALGGSNVAAAGIGGPAAIAPFAPIAATGTGAGAAAIVRIAEGEVGQAEMPPGSNDSPRIAQYRSATAGSGVGPWCAYFVSWCARQAGTPIGEQGQGYGAVDDVWGWAQRTGRAVGNGTGYMPHPGDLIVLHQHIGIVESVLPDGRIQTIEGNSSDRVSRNLRGSGEAIGYVRMS